MAMATVYLHGYIKQTKTKTTALQSEDFGEMGSEIKNGIITNITNL